jgi:hypothetical protein
MGDGRTFFAASESFGVECFLIFAVALWNLAGELALVREDRFPAQRGHERVQLSARDFDEGVLFAAV